MRITRDTLLKAAKTYVMQQTMRDRHVICVPYLAAQRILIWFLCMMTPHPHRGKLSA
jgi:hypothetical protein